ncbi:MAG: hypothetical protein ACYCT1_18500 [Steroidobacteraceae bacterium]
MSKPNGRCQCCRHPQVWMIETLLARGASLRDVAGKFNLEFSCVGRHWKRHVTAARRETLRRTIEQVGDDTTPSLNYLTRMRDSALRLLDAMEHTRTRNLQGYASVLGRARELQLDIARFRGEDGNAPAGRLINGAAMPAEAELERRVLEAVADDPEACAKLARALRTGEMPPAPARLEVVNG